MHLKTTSPHQARLITSLPALLCLAAASLSAQTAAPAPTPLTDSAAPTAVKPVPVESVATVAKLDDETVEISPFVVTADEDTGYLSTNTLAGSSLNMPLRDVAAQVSVFNETFLNDIAATNIEEAFLYSTNIETSLEFASSDGNDNVASLNNNNRIRGLGTASPLRGLFQTNIQSDAYNSERFTIASGANSILFGEANAGGSMDSTPQGGSFRNANRITVGFDNYGSERYTANVNRVLIPRILAVRFAALHDDKSFFREPSYDLQRRYYGAVTFQPFKNTTIRGNTESIRRDASRASTVLPRDLVSLWLAGVDRTVGTADDRPTVANTGTTTGVIAPANPLSAVFTNNTQGTAPVYYYGNNDLSADGVYFNRFSVETRLPQNATGILAPDRFPYSLNDVSIYDHRGVNTWGDVRRNDVKGYAHQVTLEQRFGQNLFLQLGYAEEQVDERAGGYTGSTNTVLAAEVRADANQFINNGPGRIVANPNVGKLYIEQRSIGNISFEGIEQFRAQAVYRVDFTKQNNLLRWLGRYQLGAGWTDVTKEEISQQFYRTVGGNPSWDPTGSLRHNYDPRRFRIRYYLDAKNPAAANPFPGTDVLETAYIVDPANGNLLPVYMFDAPNGGFRDAVFRRLNTITNKYTLTGNLWKDRIMPFYGLIESRIRRSSPYLIDNPTANPRGVGADGSGFFPRWDKLAHGPYDYSRKGEKRNWGVVFRPFSLVSLRYNQSETFKLNEDGSLGPFGDSIPGGIGKSTDWGFRLHTRDDRFNFSLNFFKNSQLNNRAPSGEGVYISNGLLTTEEAVIAANTAAGITTPLLGVDLATNGSNLYRGVSDYEATGLDAELTYRPNKQWRMLLNIGRQETVDRNLLSAWGSWVEQRKAVWESVAGGWDSVIVPFAGRTVHEEYDLWISRYGPLVASDGKIRENQREWRVNTFVNYDFRHAWLKGFSAGAGARWRSANVIGLGLIDGSTTLLDPNKKYFGDDELNFDLKLAYQFKAFRGSKMRVQLNVRNLTKGENELTGIRALTDGSIALIQALEPRIITVSSTLDF